MKEPCKGNALRFLIQLAEESMPWNTGHADMHQHVEALGPGTPLRNPQMPSLATVSFGGGVLHSDVSSPCVLMPESPAWELNSRT